MENAVDVAKQPQILDSLEALEYALEELEKTTEGFIESIKPILSPAPCTPPEGEGPKAAITKAALASRIDSARGRVRQVINKILSTRARLEI